MNKEKRIQELFNEPRMVNNNFAEPMQHAEYLYEMIKEFYKPDFVMVEVGSFSGGSTELFALNVKKVFSIDPYTDSDNPIQEGITVEGALRNLENAEKVFIKRMAEYKNVTKIRKLSMDAVDDFEDESLDAIYIDGNHRYDSVCNDIIKWYSKIKPGGIISGHDYYQNVKLAVDNTLGEPLKIYKDRSWLIIKGDEKMSETLIKTIDTLDYGLFAYVFQVLGLLSKEKITYVDFAGKSLFYDKSKGENAWEYYFKQPCEKDLKTAYEKIKTGEITKFEIDCFDSSNRISIGNKILQRDKKSLDKIRDRIKNKIIIQPHIVEKINLFYDVNMKGHTVLGIQKRGTDSYHQGHAYDLFDIKDAFIAVNEKINEYDKLFLITDEVNTLEQFRDRYGDKLIHYDPAALSDNDLGIHRGGSNENKYKLGEDVLIETELLSRVNYLLAMNSNLSLWAILKGDLQYNFIDSHIRYKV